MNEGLQPCPEFADTCSSYRVLKSLRKQAPLRPYGLLTVAAMLAIEWGKRLGDLSVVKLRANDEQRYVKNQFPFNDTSDEKHARRC